MALLSPTTDHLLVYTCIMGHSSPSGNNPVPPIMTGVYDSYLLPAAPNAVAEKMLLLLVK
jgi:hypothetical protein